MLGSETTKYLSEIAKDAYEHQAELNESLWRSLPFFAAALGLAVTLLGHAAKDVPGIGWSFFPIATNLLLWLSGACFAWAFRWFWLVVSSQNYEYPSDQAEVRVYAEEMSEYHAFSGLSGADLDARVLDEMRMFMAIQLGDAARTNLANNARKLKARSQVLLFMMTGFLLAIATEGFTYGYELLYS